MSNKEMHPHIRQILIAKNKGLIDVPTIMELTGKTESWIHRVLREAEHDFQGEDLRKISNYLSDRGFNGVARMFYSPEYSLHHRGDASANGRVDDELADLVESAGEFSKNFKKRCTDSMASNLEELTKVISRMQAEMERV